MGERLRELYYIADPMCSWCYGFAGVIQGIHAQYQDRIDISLVTGGLRVGNGHPFTAAMKESTIEHWREVEDMTGQRFNYKIDMPKGWMYNSEPACRAAVVMRNHLGDEVFPFFETLHKAFYRDCKDLTDPKILQELAKLHELDGEVFMKDFEDEKTKDQTQQDFEFGQRLGLQGFPSIVLRNARGLSLLTSGYQHWEDLFPMLDTWLESSEHYDSGSRRYR